MGKFSDYPQYLLREYFNEIKDNNNPTGIGQTTGSDINKGMLLCPNKTICAVGGYWTKLYVKTTPEFIELKVKPKDNVVMVDDDNIFQFNVGTVTSKVDETLEVSEIEPGAEVYIRSDSYFHDWLKKRAGLRPTEIYYINYDKFFLYLGKIYKEYADDEYNIETDSLKNFMVRALPYHQQTERMVELLTLFYDHGYLESYNRLKTAWSMLDPMEIDDRYLWYESKSFNVELNEQLSITKKREFIRDILSLLKRKGTFTSLYIIWYLLSAGSLNRLNVYERWHPKNVTGDPTGYLTDHLYQSYYGSDILMPEATTAGRQYYTYWFNKSTYPTSIAITLGGETIVDHNLGTYELVAQVYDADDNLIMPDNITLIDENRLAIEMPAENNNALVLGLADYSTLATGSSIVVQHGLNSINLIIQCYDADLKVIEPLTVKYDNNNQCTLTFNDVVTVRVNIINAAKSGMFAGTTEYTLLHELAKLHPITSTWKTDSLMVSATSASHSSYYVNPDLTVGVDADNLKVTLSEADTGWLTANPPDFEKIFTTDAPILSPHYRVEFDMSGEPLNYSVTDSSQSTIINEQFISDVIYLMDLMKPVTRYVNYNYLLRFNGALNNKMIPTYAYPYHDISWTKYTKYLPTLSLTSGSMIHHQELNTMTWHVQHNLNSNNLLIQCYNESFTAIMPTTITAVSADAIELTFDVPASGWVFITLADETFNSTATSAWTINHTLGTSYVLPQFDDNNHAKLIPTDVILSNINLINSTFATAVSGASVIELSDYRHIQDIAATTWYIEHDTGYLLNMVQFYDATSHQIYPTTMTLVDQNNMIAVFDEAVSGYALIKNIGNIDLDDLNMNNLVGGHYQIGEGTTATYDATSAKLANSLESMTVSGNILRVREDSENWYVDFRDTSVHDINITEFGLFNKYNELTFYSKLKPLFKPSNCWFYGHYKISKDKGVA